MSSSHSHAIVEHIVLLKAKDGVDSSKVNDMLIAINDLTSLDEAIYLTVGRILRNGSSSSFDYTHFFHSRHSSKEDLAAYKIHPNHRNVVKDHIFPVCDDILTVDWVANDFQGPLIPPVGSALRATLFKVKENLGEDVKNEIVKELIKENSGENITQLTFGENFSPVKADEFPLASLAIFSNLSELEAVDSNQELAALQKDMVKEHLESVIVVDYVIAPPPSASF